MFLFGEQLWDLSPSRIRVRVNPRQRKVFTVVGARTVRQRFSDNVFVTPLPLSAPLCLAPLLSPVLAFHSPELGDRKCGHLERIYRCRRGILLRQRQQVGLVKSLGRIDFFYRNVGIIDDIARIHVSICHDLCLTLTHVHEYR